MSTFDLEPVICGSASEKTCGHVCRVDPLLGARCVTRDPYSPVPMDLPDRWELLVELEESYVLGFYEYLHCDWPKP